MFLLLAVVAWAYERGQRVKMMAKVGDEWTDVSSKVAPRFRERHSAKLDAALVRIDGFEVARGACILDHDSTRVLAVHCEPAEVISYSWRWRGDFDHDAARTAVLVLVFVATIALAVVAKEDAQTERRQADNLIHDHYRRGRDEPPAPRHDVVPESSDGVSRRRHARPDMSSTLPEASAADLAVYASSMY